MINVLLLVFVASFSLSTNFSLRFLKQIRILQQFHQTCSIFADSSNGAAQYKELTGNALPYKSTSIVKSDCVSCIEPERYEEDNDDDGIEISERIEEMYQVAGKCETNMDIDYPVENACGFVAGLQTLDSKGTPSGGGSVVTTILTDVFAVMFIFMAIYVIYLYRSKFLLFRYILFQA